MTVYNYVFLLMATCSTSKYVLSRAAIFAANATRALFEYCDAPYCHLFLKKNNLINVQVRCRGNLPESTLVVSIGVSARLPH